MDNQTHSSDTTSVNVDNIPQEVITAKEAFIFGLPLVLFDITKKQTTNYATPNEKGAPVNQILNKTSFPDDTQTAVVRPNCDTYYSTAFLDLSDGPIVMSVPPTGEQYYMLPLLDAYTNALANAPGTRTEEISGGNYLIMGPDADLSTSPEVPDLVSTIYSTTNDVWLLGRFQVDNPNSDGDGPSVVALQNQLALTPLSAWGTDYTPPQGSVTHIDGRDPNSIVASMSINDFFARLNNLLIANPPYAADQPAMDKFKSIGVGVGLSEYFNDMEFSDSITKEMSLIPRTTLLGLKTISNMPPEPGSNNWTGLTEDTVANFGTQYYQRAMISYIGLGANLVADAVYYKTMLDVNGDKLDGSKKYSMTFDTSPPVTGFWSLTMYDNDGYFISNVISRYALGHSTEYPLVMLNNNTSWRIYVQNEAIDSTDPKFNNWLPAPSGEFNLLLRAYWPDAGVLDGEWIPPAVVVARSE